VAATGREPTVLTMPYQETSCEEFSLMAILWESLTAFRLLLSIVE
jgi:hypothetical protein